MIMLIRAFAPRKLNTARFLTAWGHKQPESLLGIETHVMQPW